MHQIGKRVNMYMSVLLFVPCIDPIWISESCKSRIFLSCSKNKIPYIYFIYKGLLEMCQLMCMHYISYKNLSTGSTSCENLTLSAKTGNIAIIKYW